MKVKDLIKHLHGFNPELEVVTYYDPESTYYSVNAIDESRLEREVTHDGSYSSDTFKVIGSYEDTLPDLHAEIEPPVVDTVVLAPFSFTPPQSLSQNLKQL